MKKNLLFAGLLLAAIPIWAADELPDEPKWNPATDPYQMFLQDFEFESAGLTPEQAFKAWQSTKIDSIEQVQYYVHEKEGGASDNLGNGKKPWTDRDNWRKGPWRDTLLILRNDVMVADNATDSNAMRFDTWSIIDDFDTPAGDARKEAMSKYNLTGGRKYFRYVSTDTAGALSNSSAWGGSNGTNIAARYRRNLFVRGIKIEPYSSYRLTAYVTAHKDGKKDLEDDSITLKYKPTMFFDVMRGHFASEKPFTMGIENDATHYKYNKKFEKTVVFENANSKRATYKEDDWSKVTFMTYYINDSIANDYVFVDGYWWDAEWKWIDSVKTGGKEYNYIVQPDKFFVRVGFGSDSTTFGVDEVSLTKSWIGGCEFNSFLIRVDFGYNTNMKDLCNNTTTGIPAIELPAENFDVFGHYTEEGEGFWERAEVTTAEYHKDGYMYIFQDKSVEYPFGDYDSIVVSFRNPTDPSMRLCYDMNSVFPNAWDTAWIKSGCPVKDFTNERATANPIIEGIHSMYDLPPVFRGGYDYEISSFQLPDSTTSLTFNFSKRIAYEKVANIVDNTCAVMNVTKAGVSGIEYWEVSNITNDTLVTFTRPTEGRLFGNKLSGDYQFEIVQIFGSDESEPSIKLTEPGENVAFTYSFGDASMPAGVTDYVDFSSYDYEKLFTLGVNVPGFTASNCATRIAQFSGAAFSRGLLWGVWGKATNAQANANDRPKLQYKVSIPADGVYDIEFGMTMGDGYGQSSLYVYMMDENGKQDTLDGTGNQCDLNKDGPCFKVRPTSNVDMEADVNDVTPIEVAINTYKFHTTNIKAGDYTISFEQNTSYDNGNQWWHNIMNAGMILYSLEVVPSGNSMNYDLGIAYGPMSTFSKATAALAKTIQKAAADVNKYTGTTYANAVSVKTDYDTFNSTVKVTAPSDWNAASAAVSAADQALIARIALVDAMYAQKKILTDSLTSYSDKGYNEMLAYVSADEHVSNLETLAPKDVTDDSIKSITDLYKNDVDKLIKNASAIDEFLAVKAIAADSIGNANFATLAAYDDLQNAFNVAGPGNFDCYTSSVEDIKAQTSALMTAVNAYVGAILTDQFNQAYIADLAALPGLDLSTSAQEIADMLAAKQYGKLEVIYKNSIKARLYSEIVNETASDSLPLNALIKNNKLYATAIVNSENSEVKHPQPGVFDKAADGYNIMAVYHQWNNVPIWIMYFDTEMTNLFPGWTVKHVNTYSGNRMATVDNGYNNFKAGKTFFDGQLTMDWGSKAELSTVIEDLPVGKFYIGADFQNDGNSNLTVMAVDTIAQAIPNGHISDGNTTHLGNWGFENVAINDTTKLGIALTLASGNGSSFADNFFFVFREKLAGVSYEALRDAAVAAIQSNVTFDDAAEEAEAKYEYYTLDGIKTDAPKGIVIRVNVANGNVDKVLVK